MSEEFGLISDYEVAQAIAIAEIIEEYVDDKPYPSCLLFGLTGGGRPLHIVCALNEQESVVIIITVYEPNPDLWIDFKVRKEK